MVALNGYTDMIIEFIKKTPERWRRKRRASCYAIGISEFSTPAMDMALLIIYKSPILDHCAISILTYKSKELRRTIRGLGTKLEILCFYLMPPEHYFFTNCLQYNL